MTLREFTPEEKVVFDAIVEQRKTSKSGDCFIYDAEVGQRYLIIKNLAIKYGIGIPEQMNIIHKLAKDGILSLDWVEYCCEEYASAVCNYSKEFDFLKDEPFILARKTEWGRKMLIDNVRLFLTKEACDRRCFIRLSFRDIKDIYGKYFKRYTVTLGLDEDRLRLFVEYGNEKYYFAPFKDDSIPYRVVQYAIKKPSKVVTRNELKRNRIDVRERSMKSTVFSDNATVSKILNQFIELNSDSIMISTTACMTLEELKSLKSHATA